MPPAKAPDRKYRVQFDFTPDALTTLDDLKTKLGVSSRADVIRYGLRVLQWVLEQLMKGNKILVQEGETAQAVVFPFLDPPLEPPAPFVRTPGASGS